MSDSSIIMIHKHHENCSTAATDKSAESEFLSTHTMIPFFFQNGVVTFHLISLRFLLINESFSEKLTANIKLTMTSIYLAHRIPEFNSNSRFAILLLFFFLFRLKF